MKVHEKLNAKFKRNRKNIKIFKEKSIVISQILKYFELGLYRRLKCAEVCLYLKIKI